MLYLDVDQLNARFFATALTYKAASGSTVTLPLSQILVDNGPEEDLDDTAPFVRWTVNPGESVLTGISPSLYTSLGTATLQIFIPKGLGTTMAREIGTAFEDSFRQWRSDDSCLRVYKVGSARGGDKDFFQLNVNLAYKSDRTDGPQAGPLNFSLPKNSGYVAMF